MLVVNSASWASQAVANEFVRLRQIPPNNLLYIAWDGGFEMIEAQEFRERLLGPVLKTIDERGLADQIDYIVYSSDFPYAVDIKADLNGQKVPEQLTPVCSINAMTYMWQMAMSKNPNLIGLRTNQYMREAKDRTVDVPVHGFRGWYGWGPEGQLLDAGGTRYFLSTVLAVTSGRGNSVPEVIDYLRRSAGADGSHPAGTIYYMKNKDVRSTARADAFAAAIEDLEKMGVKGVVEEGNLPDGRADVQGAMIGASDFNWGKSGSTILPGAICEHLTSFGGILSEGGGQTPLTEFLRYGAAGASGTVVEPIAIQDKFPVPAVQVRYAQGCTLAEAFYQSVFGPFQLLIVGDPLCRPWANIPIVKAGDFEAISPEAKVSGIVEIVPASEFPAKEHAGGDHDGKVDRIEVFVDGRRLMRGKANSRFRLDTTDIGDGYHSIRVVAIEAGPIETQGREIVPLWVDNQGHTIDFSAIPAGKVRWDQKLVLKAKAPEMQSIAFFHNGRLIGKLDKDEGQIEVNPRVFGTGPVELRAVGLTPRSGCVRLCLFAPARFGDPSRQTATGTQEARPQQARARADSQAGRRPVRASTANAQARLADSGWRQAERALRARSLFHGGQGRYLSVPSLAHGRDENGRRRHDDLRGSGQGSRAFRAGRPDAGAALSED